MTLRSRTRRRWMVWTSLVFFACAARGEVWAQEPGSTAPNGQAQSEEDPPRWWQKMGVALGPGIRIERVADDATTDDVTVDFTLINRAGGGGGLPFDPFNRQWKGFAPALRLSVIPRRTAAVDMLEEGAVYLGRVNLRPLMGGIRWSRPIRPRVAAELFAVTGYSFNGFDEAEDGEERPEGPRVVLPSSVSTVSNSWVWEAGARLWFELHPRVAFTTGLSYLRTRPSVTLLDGSQRSWDGDRVRIEAGIAFTLVKKRQ